MQAPGGLELRAWAPIVGLGVAVVLLWVDGVPRWVGAAYLLAIAPSLPLRLPPRIAALLPFVALAGLVALLLGELAVGHPPASRDHAIHYFQTHVLLDEMLPSGRLWGWSTRLNGGFPSGETYPLLGYAFTGALHLVSGGVIDLRVSYAFGLLAVWIVCLVGPWRLASLAWRDVVPRERASIVTARWAGALAGALWLLDPGASRQGGWNYLMFHGVWPQALSNGLWAWSLAETWRAFEQPSPRRIALAGVLLGGSLLSHPFGLLTAATSTGLTLVFGLALAERARLAPGLVRCWLAIHGLALALALGWLLVFFGSAEAMERSPVPWESLGTLAFALWTGALTSPHLAWVGPLVVVGFVMALRRGRGFAPLLVGLAATLLLLGSYEAITALRLDLLVSGFKNLQFIRYAIALKPLLCAGAAVGACWLVVALGPRQSGPSSLRSRFLIALVVAPVVVGAIEAAPRLVTRPVGALDTLERSSQAEVERSLLTALQAEQATASEPIVVAFFRAQMGGGTFPIFSIVDAGGRLVLDAHVATINFRHRFTRSLSGLRALGVTHVVHDAPIDDAGLEAALEEVGRYGRFRLARLLTASDDPFPIVHSGRAAVEVMDVRPEHLEARIEVRQSPARVRIARAEHVRWSASLDGEPLEIVEGSATHLAVDVPSSGRLVLDYRRRPSERIAGWLGAIALAIALLGLGFGRPLTWRTFAWTERARRSIAIAIVVLGIAIAYAVVERQRRRLETVWTETLDELAEREHAPTPHRFVRDLVLEGEITVRSDERPMCDGLLGKDVLSGCSEASAIPMDAMLYREPYLYRCLQFAIAPGAAVDVELAADGTEVVGLIGAVEANEAGRVRFRTTDPDAEVHELGRPAQFFRVGPDAPHAGLQLRNRGNSPARVCIAAIAVQ